MGARSTTAARGSSTSRETGVTIRNELENLRRMFPKRNGLHLYASAKRRDRRSRAATLYVYIRSTDNTYALHQTLFVRRRPFDPGEWRSFMDGRVFKRWKDNGTPAEREGILRGAIIPGINIRTAGKFWAVVKIIGYVTHDIHGTPITKMDRRRHKAESQGESDG